VFTDAAGNANADGSEANNTVTMTVNTVPPDTISPMVSTFSPADAATGVAVGSNIVLTFSETVSRGTGNIEIRSGSATGTLVESFNAATSTRLSLSGSTLTIDPTNNLAGSTEYFVLLPSGSVKDVAANSYAGSSNYNFSTIAAVNIINGTSGNNVLASTSGNDSISAGAGLDIVVYQGKINQYSIQINRAAKTAIVTDSQSLRDGQDTLIDVEKLQFGNQTFDIFNRPRTETPTHSKTNSFLFDASYYLMSHPDLAGTVNLQDAFGHYLSTGAANGHNPNMWFDPAYYANRWPDLKPLNLTPDVLFQHYNLFGVWEGRSAGPMFNQYDGNRYLAENPDVGAYVDGNLAAFLGSRSNGAIAHYIIYGADEGRVAFDLNGAQLETAVLIGIPIINL
jgi:hypothetical protein